METTNPLVDMIIERLADRLFERFGTVPTVDRSKVAAVVREAGSLAREAGSTVSVLDDEPAQRPTIRRTRKSGPMVAYFVQNVPNLDAFTDNDRMVYKALSGKNGKNRKPMTENDVIAATGRKDGSAKKAVQSSIWKLRNHDKDGERLDLNNAKDAKKAIVANVRAE